MLRERRAEKERERLLLNKSIGDGKLPPPPPPPAPSRRRLPSLSSSEFATIRRPWASRSAPSSSLEASAALATHAEEGRLGGRLGGVGCGVVDGSVDGGNGDGGNGGGGGESGSSGLKAAAEKPATTKTAAAAAAATAGAPLTTATSSETAAAASAASAAATAAAAAADRADSRRLAALDAEYHAWLSWCIDLACAVVFGVTYLLAAVLIFVVSSQRAPGICHLAGVTGDECEAALALEREERNRV